MLTARSIMAVASMNKKDFQTSPHTALEAMPRACPPTSAAPDRDCQELPADLARSKNWDEFANFGDPPRDFVFTICDNAGKEVCPVWPDQPMTAP